MEASDKRAIWASRVSNTPYGGLRAPGDKIRVLLVDDHAVYRQGLRSMLKMERDMEVIGEAGDGKEAIEQVGALKPDVVLMDINMPGMDGMEATRKLADAYPGVLIIMLTMFKGEEHLREARRAGASAYVVKDADSELLVQTIRDVMSGDVPLLQGGDQHPTGPLSTATLPIERHSEGDDRLITANERTILKFLAEGLNNDGIAHRMGIPEGMVRTYLSEIYSKLGLGGREAAVQYARNRGFGEEC